MSEQLHPDGFTEQDCTNCISYITEIYPAVKERLARLAEAGFSLPQPAQDNEDHYKAAMGFIRAYAPHRLPVAGVQ